MKGLALSVVVFLICITLFGASQVVSSGNNMADYQPRTLKGLIAYLSENSVDVSFEKTISGFENAKESIYTMENIIDEYEYKTFGDSSLEWYERVCSFIAWLGVVIGQVFNFLSQLFGIIFLIVFDFIDMFVWIFQIISYFTSLSPVAA